MGLGNGSQLVMCWCAVASPSGNLAWLLPAPSSLGLESRTMDVPVICMHPSDTLGTRIGVGGTLSMPSTRGQSQGGLWCIPEPWWCPALVLVLLMGTVFTSAPSLCR